MPATSVIFGIMLIAVGAAGYIYAMQNGNASMTALIPAAFGLVLALAGAAAMAMENLRKHLMHLASAVALLGFILTAGRLLMKIGDLEWSPAVMSQMSMAAICLVFVLLAVRSFAAARAAGPDQP